MIKNDLFPDLGKLSIAILEALVKPVIGEEAIKVLKAPAKEKELRSALASALQEAERRFKMEYKDMELCQALLDLPLSNLPSIQMGLRVFYNHPANPRFRQLLEHQLFTDYSHLDHGRIEKAVEVYLVILRQELISVSDEMRQKLVAWSLLGIHQTLQTLVSGDEIYRRFAQSPALGRHIRAREFQTIVHERTKGFVGRDFIFQAIDELLNEASFPSGYIVIKGEPGIGKTTLISELVKRGGYVHHFNLSLQNIHSARDFLANVCAQLIIRYELEHSSLPQEATRDSGFLSQLLAEATAKQTGQPIVILIDALDEADDVGLPSGANILYLPPALPDHTYLVITTRESADYRLLVDRQREIYLRDDDPQNVEDVRQYIRNFIQENSTAISSYLQGWKISQEAFVESLTDKSEGNFMYLVYVLGDMRAGRLTIVNLDHIRDLPKGLKAYYQRHWRMMKSSNRVHFEKHQQPVICILAAALEPVSISLLQEWTGLAPQSILEVIGEWREFLNVDEAEDELLYRIYHSSFQDFLKEEVGLGKYHEQIVMTALRKIPGFLTHGDKE
jgi:hypothetical protein